MFDRDNYVTRFNDMLTLRDLADSTVNNYTSYLNQYLDFVESSLGGKLPEDVSWEEIRSYILQMKTIRSLNNRSINPHIAQLIFFSKYVLHREWEALLTRLYKTRWNVFVKETFNGNGNAIAYLSRYAYRTAISNSRIVSVTAEGVTISYKDYSDGSKVKTLRLSGEEFIRRFLMHILPKGFSRIRYSGYLANACRRKNIRIIRKLTATSERINCLSGMKVRDRIRSIFGIDICKCPLCSSEMYLIRHRRACLLC